MKIRVSEICVKQIRVYQRVGVFSYGVTYLQIFELHKRFQSYYRFVVGCIRLRAYDHDHHQSTIWSM